MGDGEVWLDAARINPAFIVTVIRCGCVQAGDIFFFGCGRYFFVSRARREVRR